MTAEKLQIRMFGGLEAQCPEGGTVAFSTRKTALLFAYLALKAGEAQPRARLSRRRRTRPA
jgi:two-component SAPR family response regulator